MASGQTSNYGLNQWAAEDQVIRTEFNEDNAKIDTKIQALVNADKIIKVTELAMEEDCYQVDILLDKIDLSQFSMLRILVSAATGAGGLWMRMNNISSSSYYTTSSTSTSNPEQYTYADVTIAGNRGISAKIDLMPYNLGQYTAAMIHSEGLYSRLVNATFGAVCTSVPFTELAQVNFLGTYDTYTIKAGSRFDVYGLLK